MAPGLPSLTALLSLLAVAGVQNRKRITELLGQTGDDPANDNGDDLPRSSSTAPEQTDELLDGLSRGSAGGLGGLLAGTSIGEALNAALGSLMEQFERNGQGRTARSWVGNGENEPIGEGQLEQALGDDLVAELTRRTGLGRQELLARLSHELPSAVDELTPNGEMPSQTIENRQEPS